MACRITSFPASLICIVFPARATGLSKATIHKRMLDPEGTLGNKHWKWNNNLQLQEEFAVISPGHSHAGVGTLSYKVLRTVHFPLQSLWAELFFVAAQRTVPTCRTALQLPVLNSPISLLFHIILLTSLRWGSKSRAFPVIPPRTSFQRNFVWKHTFATGVQKSPKTPKGRKESLYHVSRGTCLEHLTVSHLHYILNLATLCIFVYTYNIMKEAST